MAAHAGKYVLRELYTGVSCTVKSRFLKPSVSRTSRYLEPNLVSLGFASLELYNFTPDFSNPRFLETPDNSNQFFLPWDKLTLDNSNLRKFRNNLVRMSVTSTPLNKLTLPDKLFCHILITQQASHKSVISLEGTMTASYYRTKVPLFNCFSEAVAFLE